MLRSPLNFLLAIDQRPGEVGEIQKRVELVEAQDTRSKVSQATPRIRTGHRRGTHQCRHHPFIFLRHYHVHWRGDGAGAIVSATLGVTGEAASPKIGFSAARSARLIPFVYSLIAEPPLASPWPAWPSRPSFQGPCRAWSGRLPVPIHAGARQPRFLSTVPDRAPACPERAPPA